LNLSPFSGILEFQVFEYATALVSYNLTTESVEIMAEINLFIILNLYIKSITNIIARASINPAITGL